MEDNTTMEGIIMQQEDRVKKAHKLICSQESQIATSTTTNLTQEQMLQIKRQKVEDKQRAGTARQASPRQ
jgi:hypothetical protein